MGKTFFNSQDAPSAKLAEFFCTIDGRRYSMINAKKFEAKATVKTKDVPRLGTMIDGKKATGLEIKLTFTVYKCSPMFDKVIEKFKKTGVLPTFECQVTTEDKATSIGKDTKIYNDCVIDGDVLLSMFDSAGDFIEQEITAYAMDYKTKKRYKEPDYM